MVGGGPSITQLLTCRPCEQPGWRTTGEGGSNKRAQREGGTSLAAQWVRLCFTAGDTGSNSGRATEIPHAAQHKTATKRWELAKTSPPRWLTCSLLSALSSLGSSTGFSGGTVSRSLQTFAWERREERPVINLHLGQKEPDHPGFLRASVASLAMGMMAQITQVMLGKDQLPPGPSQALTTFLLVLCFPSLANYGIVSQNSNIFFKWIMFHYSTG